MRYIFMKKRKFSIKKVGVLLAVLSLFLSSAYTVKALNDDEFNKD